MVGGCEGHYQSFWIFACYSQGTSCDWSQAYSNPMTAWFDDGSETDERGEPCDQNCPWEELCFNNE